MKRSLAVILFLLAFGCASAGREEVHVVVVGTTDVHGWFAGHVETPAGGGEEVVWGGLPVLASYVGILRGKHRGRVLVVDSGDMFQGTLESNLFEGEAVVRGYNVIGYTAAAVGNHEFDFGPAGPESLARTPDADALGALKRNAGLATFPLLSANMIDRAMRTTPAWAKPYVIVRAGGARIGIIGLSTPDTPNVTMAANVVSLEFTDPVAATIAAAKDLRAAGVDAVFVIAHMGGRCTKFDDPHDHSSCEPEHEVMGFMEKIPAGTIDAFFAGHSHSQMRHSIKGVPVVQGLAYSREFSRVDFRIDTKKHRVTSTEIFPHTMICQVVYDGTEHCDPRRAPAGARLVPRVYEGAKITADARVATVIEPYLQRVAAKRDELVGVRTADRFTRNYTAESSLGNLIADALREAAGADFALMNSGGIRDELRAGELKYADIFAVSPFDNYPALVMLTGKQIEDILRATTNGVRGIMQVSGLRYTYDASRELAEDKHLVSVARDDGSPLNPETLYSVAMPDFVAAGGDGTQDVMKSVPPDRKRIFQTQPIREVLIEMWKKRPQPLVSKTEGRVTVLNAPERRP